MTAASAVDAGLADRLEFMELDAATREVLRSLQPLIANSIGAALDVFYRKVRNTPATSHFFADAKHIAHAKGAQMRHWEVIASAEFGADYAAKVQAIGKAHARLGLEPRWYIGGYALLTEQLVHAIVAEKSPRGWGRSKQRDSEMARALSALVKVVMLDMDLAISTYLDALDTQRRQAEEARELAQRNQAEALDVLSHALKGLAAGDLGARIEQPLAQEFEHLKADFNATVGKLASAMSSIQSASSTIAAGAGEISSASDDLSRRTEQQAASLEQTAAALEQITTTVKTAAQGASHARDIVASAKCDAEQGGQVLSRAVEAMASIDKSSEQIAQIIGVIDEIAFQTNLLALNAGVEAARAGDAGRGFAVVASEVRALAQRSADAAKEIKGLIETSTRQVKDGVELVAESGRSFSRIVSQVTDINAVVGEIASGAHQQVTALQEVNGAVGQIDQVTQQNAAMSEQATAASHALAHEASGLDRLVGNFKLAPERTSGEGAHLRVVGAG